MAETSRYSIAEMQQLTQEYARFSQSRTGLGNVLGGVAGLIIVATLWFAGGGAGTAALTVGLTCAWLVGKEVLRRRYRVFGSVREVWPAAERRSHAIAVGVITLVLAAFALMIVVHSLTIATPWSIALPYLVFCLLTPVIAWRYLRTTGELMVGVYLLFASAVTSAGFVPDRVVMTACLPVYALLLVRLGLREHQQFRALAARLRPREDPSA